MSKVILKEITISNFKGTKEAHYDFNEIDNVIKGKNGCGKTTLKEAYLWCLGKDVKEIIPCKDNVEIPNLDIEVELKIDVDGVEFLFKRVQKQKYKVDKTTNEKIRNGNESKTYIDNIEYAAKDYKEKIAVTFGLESYDIFTLVSDIEYFNGETNAWKWTNRRQELFSHISIDNTKILNLEKYKSISGDISKGYDLTQLKKSYKTQQNDIKSLKEKNLAIIESAEKELEGNENVEDENLLQDKLNKLLNKQQNIYVDTKKIQDTLDNYNKLHNNLIFTQRQLEDIENNIKKEKQNFEEIFETDNTCIEEAKNKSICPVCHSTLSKENIDKNIDKLVNSMKKDEERYENNIKLLEDKEEEVKRKIDSINETIEMFEFEYNVDELKEKTNISKQIQTLNDEIFEIKGNLMKIQNANSRRQTIEKLQQDNLKLTSNEATIISNINLLNSYSLDIAKEISDEVNNLFPKNVTFALFDFANYKGDIEDVCVSIYKGKTYGECSTGEKYVLNYLITETLQNLYNVNLPMWCDNYECLSTELKSERQLIKLEVEK